MRKTKKWAISSVGACALCSGAQPALAQVATAPAPADVSASAPDGEEIVVTGFRGAAKRAQDIKRNAPSVVEAITLEDLGKFTDSSISDALQRVPGVQIERRASTTFGSIDAATIRGLTGATTTLNGRAVLGSAFFTGTGLRNFDLGSVPPEILAGVTVYKTSTASQIEPGLAGQINLQTLRPLDFAKQRRQKLFGAVTASGGYESESGKISPRGSVTIGGSLFGDTLGLYVSGLYAKDRSLTDETTIYDGGRVNVSVLNPDNSVTAKTGVRTFNGFSTWRANNTLEKKSLAGGVQWKPTRNIEVNAEVLYNQFTTKRDDQTAYVDMSGITGALSKPTVRVRSDAIKLVGPAGNQFISYLNTAGITGPTDYPTTNYASYFNLRNSNDFYNYGLNAAYKTDDERLKVVFDYGRTTVRNFFRWVSPYVYNNGTNAIADVSGDRPRLSVVGADVAKLANPNEYVGFGGFDELFEKQVNSNRDTAKLDLSYKLADSITLRAGLYRSQTNVRFVSLGTTIQPTSLAGYFTGGTTQLPLFNSPTPEVSFSGFCTANAVFCNQTNVGNGSLTQFPATSAGSPGDVLAVNTLYSFKSKEVNKALYGEADFDTHILGVGVSGNIGLRAVHINFSGTAIPGVTTRQKFQNDPPIGGVNTAVTGTNAYWRYLPSANMSFRPTNNTAVRLAAAKSISLADYPSLAPLGGATVYIDNSFNRFNTFSGGNPKLKPTEVWNYDVTGEYYTSYGGAFVISAFYKDMKNLLDTDVLEGITIPGLPGLFRSTTTVNRATGYTYGFELSTNQPLTFLPQPFDGLGLQANFTRIVSKVTVRTGSTRFAGSSPYTVNLTGYYEKYGWTARASLLYRPVVFQGRTYNTDLTFYDFVDPPRTTLDVSLAKKLTDNFEVIFTGSNVTGAAVKKRYDPYGVSFNYSSQPRVFSLGARAHF